MLIVVWWVRRAYNEFMSTVKQFHTYAFLVRVQHKQFLLCIMDSFRYCYNQGRL